ncbi:MAG: hypothetical protein LBC43_01140, partial [Bifidobacteriaceae bacterium]|nr:hypothetical protein [Bifidobacteriaceae bacterium]
MDNVEVELVDPLVDPMFKLVFEKEEYLASLISSVMEQFGIVVKQVQKMNTELVGFSKYAKHPVMDVLVTDQEQRL